MKQKNRKWTYNTLVMIAKAAMTVYHIRIEDIVLYDENSNEIDIDRIGVDPSTGNVIIGCRLNKNE